MRNFIVLGASALVLALGVAQASASQNNSVADFRAAASAQPAYTGELRDVRGQSVDSYASQGNDFPTLSANARSAGH
jgi:cytochrome oxidase Cu insertion factor (SCO1/SenC/PrrC family)